MVNHSSSCFEAFIVSGEIDLMVFLISCTRFKPGFSLNDQTSLHTLRSAFTRQEGLLMPRPIQY